MVDTALCVGTHHGQRPQPDIGLLCAKCAGRLRRDLADIILLWTLLDDLLIPGGRGGGHHAGKPGSRPACDLDVADLRDPRGVVHAEITGWARIVIEERRLSASPADAEQATRLLQTHLDWVAAQPWVDEAAGEIRDAAHRIRVACHDLPDPPIGRCPDIDPRGESDTCGGPLRWVDGSTAVACARCQSRWGVEDLAHVGRVSPINVWGTVPQIAEMLDAPERTVRRWVAIGKVRRNVFGQVRHADVWRILAEKKSDPQPRQTAEGPSTT